jgi:hypothetical protein
VFADNYDLDCAIEDVGIGADYDGDDDEYELKSSEYREGRPSGSQTLSPQIQLSRMPEDFELPRREAAGRSFLRMLTSCIEHSRLLLL